jgi:drug/metabolite transporter (DMT)-like permease
MTTLALSLVLLSAVLHATWNLFAKRAQSGVIFVWFADAISVVVFAPLVVILFILDTPHIGFPEIAFMLGSSFLHLAYFIALLRGYRAGDFSLVYPLARGTGPLLATLGAVVFLGEHPTLPALFGAIMITGGAFFLTGGPAAVKSNSHAKAALYGLLTGAIIGVYTLWDTYAVTTLMIPPLLQYYGSTVGRVVILAPVAVRRRYEFKALWRDHRSALFVVGILSPISYILVLTALAISPVSYVAPTREISILLGALLGASLLAEGDTVRRLAASAAMMVGVIVLALG